MTRLNVISCRRRRAFVSSRDKVETNVDLRGRRLAVEDNSPRLRRSESPSERTCLRNLQEIGVNYETLQVSSSSCDVSLMERRHNITQHQSCVLRILSVRVSLTECERVSAAC
ncbi:hypothetical protein JOB18_046700 [Solea senegalensis]|uniref:Uncharacterized protein n=1 Tax=Solea senegalensis TaxID=28829 RepID=A0AAV6SNB3_SOLSE|nr:hypothetical protein JOB18_046700 [Solea senegalensis]